MDATEQRELEAQYAAAASARCAAFVRARNVPEALAVLGLVAPGDRLVVCADDFEDAFRALFPRESLAFVAEPVPAAFLAASDEAAEPCEAAASSASSRVFWLVNSIGGFGLRVPDLRALAAAARTAGALLIVDNTVPSLFGCEPLALGAHVAFEALDRVGAGELSEKLVAVSVPFSHKSRKRPADLLADTAYELVRARAAELDPERRTVAQGDLAALARGVASLPARMQRHMDHARAIAEYLRCHPRVARVHYPGLPVHPDHAVAANVLMHGCGSAVDFELERAACGLARRADGSGAPLFSPARFLALCPCANRKAPAGGARTRISVLRSDEECIYLRLFAGVDDPLQIVDSLDQALRLFCNPPEP